MSIKLRRGKARCEVRPAAAENYATDCDSMGVYWIYWMPMHKDILRPLGMGFRLALVWRVAGQILGPWLTLKTTLSCPSLFILFKYVGLAWISASITFLP